jgi:hypothetical protein
MFNKTHNIVSIEGQRSGFTESSVVQSRVFERGSSGASGRGPESQERAREPLKCPMDFLFLFVHYFVGIFNSNPQF